MIEKGKLLNLIAGIAGAASFCMPVGVFRGYSYWIWGIGVGEESGKGYNLFEVLKDDQMAAGSLTIISAVLILAGAALFFLSMVPKFKMPVFTLLGWILGLGGCGCFVIFGSMLGADGPLFEADEFAPVGLIFAFASGGVGLVSWILQIKK